MGGYNATTFECWALALPWPGGSTIDTAGHQSFVWGFGWACHDQSTPR